MKQARLLDLLRLSFLTQTISNINGALTSRRIDDLTPNTEYDFNISAITDAGQGPAFHISHMTDMDGKIIS